MRAEEAVVKTFQILQGVLRPWSRRLGWIVKGFRTPYSKIWHLDILNILSWKNLSNSRYRKDSLTTSLPSTLKQVIRSHGRGALPVRGRMNTLISEDGGTQRGLAKLSPVYHLVHIISPHNFWPFIKPTIKMLTLWVFNSLWNLLCHVKLTLKKKFVCFSINLSFVSVIYRTPAGKPRRVEGIFSPSSTLISSKLARENQ